MNCIIRNKFPYQELLILTLQGEGMTVVLGKRRSKAETTTSRKSTMQTSRPGEPNPQAPKSKKKVRLHGSGYVRRNLPDHLRFILEADS